MVTRIALEIMLQKIHHLSNLVVGYIVREVAEKVLEKENFQLNKFVVSKSSVCGGTGITREGPPKT